MSAPMETANLSVRLGTREVLYGVDLALWPGEVLGLIGPNGAGKSTLIRALAGQVAFDGSVHAGGKPLSALSLEARARHIAYLPQKRELAWPISVAAVVALGRLPWRGVPGQDAGHDEAICRWAMDATDVTRLAHRKATELSGGEQARVLAARAFAQDTPVLLADEPAAGLDPAHQITMMLALRDLAAKGTAILVSMHDLGLAARFCDRLAVLDKGSLLQADRPAAVISAAMLSSVFGITARIENGSDGILAVTPIGLSAP